MKKIGKIIIAILAVIVVLIAVKGFSALQLLISNDKNNVIGVFETIRTEQDVDIENGEINSLSKYEETITFNGDGTYEMYPIENKGMYEVNEPGRIDLDGGSTVYYLAEDRYLYDPEISCLTEDDEYGRPPTFNEDGRMDQSFYWQKLEGRAIAFDFNSDGTYKIEEILAEGIDAGTPILISEGTYQLDGEILMLSYDGGSMPLIYDDDKIYFDVYEKQE